MTAEQKLPTAATVLLIEDDNALRRAMERFLRLDFGVVSVSTAGAGIDYIKNSATAAPRIDAVVTDWNIETRDDGSYVVEAAIAGGIPVVVVTGDTWHVRGPAGKYVLRGTPVPVLEKPFAVQTLRDVVAELLSKKNSKETS